MPAWLILFALVIRTPPIVHAQLTWRPVVLGTQGMVAAEHPLESLAAARVLERGGNAIDAAVAAFYTTAVVEPSEAGLGGDGFILAYIAKLNKVVLINGSGPAPRLARLEFYRKLGTVPLEGPHSTSVPGAVSGFELALNNYGTRDYKSLLEAAIEAATRGFPVTAWTARNLRTSQAMLRRYPSTAPIFLRDGRPHEMGELLVQTDLARTLTAIAQGGADAFYRGPVARQIAAFHEKAGGLIRLEDLSGFRAEEAPPIRTTYKEYEVFQAPPNSGGIVMLIALNIVEGFDLRPLGHNSAAYLHVLTEALKLTFADRYPYIADPRFAPGMPVAGLLSKRYAAERRSLIRMDRAIRGMAPPGDPRGGKAVLAGHSVAYEDQPQKIVASPTAGGAEEQTSSFAIADRFGNLVSVTHSINGGFGSGMVVEGAGFLLNNRFAYFGLDPADVNVLAPGKRTRQGAIPALALKNGKPFLAWNTPGGDTIPQSMLQAFLNVVEFGMNVQQAAESPTVISENFRASYYPQKPGNGLAIPKVLAEQVGAALAALGHPVRVTPAQLPYSVAPAGAGAMKLVLLDPRTGVMQGGASPAKDNYVIGW